ncbi:MAG: nuclear transport factor 2 family protein [Solirubrobacterales bacterium]
MTTHATPVDVALAFIKAWGSSDMTTVAGYVADDIAYEGPMAQANGAEAYLDAVSGFSELVTELKIIAAVGDDEQALIMYDMVTGPFGTLRAAEHLVISDGKIKTSTLVFDTHEVRNPVRRAGR